MEWKIYYGDGSTFSNEDGSWLEAPYRNVQFVLYPDIDVGRMIVSGKDYYIKIGKEIYGIDIIGLFDWMIDNNFATEETKLSDLSFKELYNAGIKLGRTLTNDEYQKVMFLAVNDTDFPKKSAYRKSEQR